MQEILTDADLDHAERFTQMVMEERARLEQSIVPSGHTLVGTRLGGALSAAGAYAELCGGVSYLEYVRALSSRVKSDWPGLLADLRRLHSLAASLPETAGRLRTRSPQSHRRQCRAGCRAAPVPDHDRRPAPAGRTEARPAPLLSAQARKDSLFPRRSTMWDWGATCAIRAMSSTVRLW